MPQRPPRLEKRSAEIAIEPVPYATSQVDELEVEAVPAPDNPAAARAAAPAPRQMTAPARRKPAAAQKKPRPLKASKARGAPPAAPAPAERGPVQRRKLRGIRIKILDDDSGNK